jgi:excisionase family DNA binding protein
VAEVLRIACSRTYQLVGGGEIPSVRIGRSIRVSRKELERWLEGGYPHGVEARRVAGTQMDGR